MNTPTILNTNNVFEYLSNLNYCNLIDRQTSITTVIPAKNFNLLINFEDGRNLLIKQELFNDRGETTGEFWSAWQMQQLMLEFPSLGNQIGLFIPEIVYFDPDNSILVVKYLSDYSDLYQYYANECKFPVEIARSIGQLLATIHSQTFQQLECQAFLADADAQRRDGRRCPANTHPAINLIDRLTRITPDVFQAIPLECLQFFRLYQRFPTLSQAIIDLGNSIESCCLVHNDLKVNNILLDLSWQQPGSQLIKLIDWELASWGDPAFDLGCILGSYLEIWLDGLLLGSTLSINESLQLATTPLELLQPSLFSLVRSYLDVFPEIAILRPDYLDRIIQFTGLALIQRVEITIDQDRTFGNRGIIMLQVAKQLLCTPQLAMSTLFGSKFNLLINN